MKELILKNPKSFLEKLRDSKIFHFNEFEEWRGIYKDIYRNFSIMFINEEDIKNPPKNYFRVTLYHTYPEKSRKNLIENYEAINSKYCNLDMFIPVRYFEKLVDESFSHNEFDFVHLSGLDSEHNIKWDLRLLQKFKKLISEFRKHEGLNINQYTNIELNFDIVEEFKDHINWASIIHFKELKWTLPLLLKYKHYIKFENRQVYTNGPYVQMGFSLHLETDWNIKTIEAFLENWNWRELCLNKYINWDAELINKFLDKVNFDSLSSNYHLKWNTELIESFKDKWNWQILSGNPSLPWTLTLMKKYDYYWKWNVKLNYYYYGNNYESEGQEVETNNHPSISTNYGINWNIEMITYGMNKLDFWRLARKGNLTLDIVKLIKKELYRKELTGWIFHKFSDFRETDDVYITGWENLGKNKSFKLTTEIINFLCINEITITNTVGNIANDGYYVSETVRLIELFKNSTFLSIHVIDFVIKNEKLLCYFINNNFINDELWEKIIAPYTISNKSELLNEFKKLKDL